MRPEIVLALLTRGTQGLVLLAAAVCVMWRLDPVEQGLFFFFISLGTLLQLSDFGLAYASLQTASHLAVSGDSAAFAGFRQKAHQLNFRILLVAALLIGLIGTLILWSKAGEQDPQLSWAAPWIAFIFGVFLTLLVNLEVTLIEGGKSPTLAWSIRFLQELIAGIAFIAALLAGARLWSLAVYWATRFTFTIVWLSKTHEPFARVEKQAREAFDWRGDVWPFQWRVGLSALCGFLTFQAFNPIVLLEQGPIIAGRFGMSVALMNVLLMVSAVWPVSQAARYGGLIRRGRFEELRHAFWTTCIASTLVAMLTGAVVFLGLSWVADHKPEYADRFTDTFTTGILLLTGVAHHVVHCFSVVLRAERREPTLSLTFFGSVLTVILVWLCARFGSPSDIALASLAVALPGIPVVIFLYLRRQIHWLTVSASHR
jgi:hypothetical protein